MATPCYNFNPGPSALPTPVREQLIAAIQNFRRTGIGILETSHRSSTFMELLDETKALLHSMLKVPDSYETIFTTGGATQQFSMVPLNLLRDDSEAGAYILSGVWAEKALEEAQRFSKSLAAASTKENGFRSLATTVEIPSNARYVHFTSNNTIYGTQYATCPTLEQAGEDFSGTIVCDASSDFCSMPIDFTKVSLVYAGAQKNVGTAGITVVIGKKELLEAAHEHTPKLLQYGTYLQSNSLYNTPPTFAIYTLFAMLQWMQREGGLAEMQRRASARAAEVYEILDALPCYRPYTDKAARSLMNITLTLEDEARTANFLNEAKSAGLHGLAGHRSVGGIRISLYNGIHPQATAALCAFLQQWAKK